MRLGRNFIFVILMCILGTLVAPSADAKSLKIRRFYPLISAEIPAEGGTANNEICPRYRAFIEANAKEQMDMIKRRPLESEQLTTQTVPIGKEETDTRHVLTRVNESTGAFKIEILREPSSAGLLVNRVITGQLGKHESKTAITVYGAGHPEPICKVIVRQNVEAEVIN